MVFSSLMFLSVFFPITLLVYYISPKNFRNFILFIFSLLFYAWGEPIYVIIMIFSTLVDYSHGLLIEHWNNSPKKRTAVLLSSVIINLGMLCFFKYSDFIINNINLIFNTEIKNLNLALPIGISFYTFQTMSYTIDVYLGNCKVQKNIINFGCYVAMFPQLIAGPIVRYVSVAEELDNRQENINDFSDGIVTFIKGMSKKVLLANNIGMLADTIQTTSISELSVVSAWLGIVAFAFQLYFDFSGYSDMAIGLGKMFGFNFPDNFNFPYISKSISEFWRRWHISLSTWFKEYVYIPLGGNRVSIPRNILNLLIVWGLTGIWHGASWNFMLWGLYFGVLLILEKFVLNKYLKKLPAFISWLYTIILVIIGWVFFSFEDIKIAFAFLGNLFGIGAKSFIDQNALYLLGSYGLILIILALCSTPLFKILFNYIKEKNIKIYDGLRIILCILGLIFSLAYIVDAAYNPFLYFRF